MTATEQETKATANLLTGLADHLVDILEDGTMDDTSREELGWLHRQLNLVAAVWTDQPAKGA